MIHEGLRVTKESCRYCSGTGWIMMQKPGRTDHNGVIHLIEYPQPCLACNPSASWPPAVGWE